MMGKAMTVRRLVGMDRGTKDETIVSQADTASCDGNALTDEIDRISEASGVGVEDLAQAFLTIRPEMSSDENALEALAAVARQCKDLEKTAPELATMLVHASKKPEGHQPTGRILVPVERGIVVPGGFRGVALPPEKDLTSGEVDPEAARLVGEGKSRYHLETLAELEAESHQPPAPMRRPGGAMLLLSAAAMMMACSNDGGMPELDEDAPAPPPAPRAPGVQTRRAPPSAKAATRPVAPATEGAEKKPGCRSAGCRTLKDCLCACGDCEVDCYDRKPRRA